MLKNRDASNYTSLSSHTPEKKARIKEKPLKQLNTKTNQKHPNKPTKV